MVAALTYVGISASVLLLLIFLYATEDAKGDRVFLKGARAFLDRLFVKIVEKL